MTRLPKLMILTYFNIHLELNYGQNQIVCFNASGAMHNCRSAILHLLLLAQLLIKALYLLDPNVLKQGHLNCSAFLSRTLCNQSPILSLIFSLKSLLPMTNHQLNGKIIFVYILLSFSAKSPLLNNKLGIRDCFNLVVPMMDFVSNSQLRWRMQF